MKLFLQINFHSAGTKFTEKHRVPAARAARVTRVHLFDGFKQDTKNISNRHCFGGGTGAGTRTGLYKPAMMKGSR